MKTISFFSEKGGVGKSSFTIMYASWLHYKYGVKVALADFNKRILAYRNAEIKTRNELCKATPGLMPYDDRNAWPITDVNYTIIRMLKNEGDQSPYANWLEVECQKGKLKGFDVVICDFPGSLTGSEFIQVCGMRLLNLIVIPIEKDEMTINATFDLHKITKEFNHCVFINKARTNFNNQRATYRKFAEILVEKGLPLLPDMVSNSDRMMSIDKVDNIRSTFGFPDFDLPEFGPAKDLGVENLFIDVTRELEKTKDLKGTGTADLSFVHSLKKKPDARQLKGTSYPEYEII